MAGKDNKEENQGEVADIIRMYHFFTFGIKIHICYSDVRALHTIDSFLRITQVLQIKPSKFAKSKSTFTNKKKGKRNVVFFSHINVKRSSYGLLSICLILSFTLTFYKIPFTLICKLHILKSMLNFDLHLFVYQWQYPNSFLFC